MRTNGAHEHDRSMTGAGKAYPQRLEASSTAERGDAASVSTAAPYPRDLERALVLPDGAWLRVRPIRPDDEPRLVELYGRLSQHTAYQRFFTVLQRLPADWAHYFANVDYRRRLALVAEHDTPVGVELVGVGRYEPTDEEGTAEVALVVQDDWQARGLGAALLDAVLAAAEARGMRRFRAYVLADNRRMLSLLTGHTDIDERKVEDGVIVLHVRRRSSPPPARG
jgi:acetyltransferase